MATSPPNSRTASRLLLRGGWIVTVDRARPVLRGDVLVDGDRIAAVGPDLSSSDARVIDARDRLVLPGFIDTHRHTWQSAIRHIGGDWDLNTYFGRVFFGLGPRFRPEDVYAGNLLGRLAALDAGVTTMLDWSHIQNSPAHSDAAVEALRDAGGRSVFAYGWPQSDPGPWITDSTLPIPEDVARVRRKLLPDDTGLVTMAVALRGPEFSSRDITRHDIGVARDLRVRMTFHAGDGEYGPRYRAIATLAEDDLLGPDMTFVHVSTSSDDELRLIAQAGASTAVATQMEMAMPGLGIPAVARLLAAGLRPALSVDTETAAPPDLFSQMRSTLAAARLVADNALQTGPLARPAVTDILAMATLEGARALGREADLGSITIGKQADLVLLRADDPAIAPVSDPVGATVLGGHPGLVDTVIVAGHLVKENGRLLGPIDRALNLAAKSQRYLLADNASTGTSHA
jgi:5-methylthioadenosine/S-adenosylhomocysteine deaminase